MRILCFYILFAMVSFPGFAQRQDSLIKLTLAPLADSHNPAFTTRIRPRLTRIPLQQFIIPPTISRYHIKEAHTQFEQYTYHQLLQGDTAVLKDTGYLAKPYTENYAPQFVNESVKLLIGFDAAQQRIVIIDSDNDKDFTNETIYTESYLKKNNDLSSKRHTPVSIEVYDKKLRRVVPKTVFVWPDLFARTYTPETDSAYYAELVFKNPTYTNTHSTPGYAGLRFYLFCGAMDQLHNAENTFILPVPAAEPHPGKLSIAQMYVASDVVVTGKQYFRLQGFSSAGDTLYIQSLTGQIPVGARKGLKAPAFSGTDIFNQQLFSYAKIVGKQYILLDFWGTWCKPCTQLTPKLKDLFHLSLPEKKISFVSIARDDDSLAVDNYIRRHVMPWTQLYEKPSDDPNAITRLFNIRSYPTFILIDKTGAIVFRDAGIDGYERLEAFLRKEKLLFIPQAKARPATMQ
jgi:thiol-disulfide isomerase/thioredoxin